MRLSFPRMVQVLALAALAVGVAGPKVAHAQMPYGVTYAVPTTSVSMPLQFVAPATNAIVVAPASNTVGVSAQAVYPVVSQATGTTDSPPDSCAPYDSWCSYCTYHAGADVCAAYPPGHRTTGTPGVGSPSTTPAGSSPAPVGGGGTSGGGGYPTPGR
jgi:hypothetical protein